MLGIGKLLPICDLKSIGSDYQQQKANMVVGVVVVVCCCCCCSFTSQLKNCHCFATTSISLTLHVRQGSLGTHLQSWQLVYRWKRAALVYWFASHDLTYKALWFLSPWVPGVKSRSSKGTPKIFSSYHRTLHMGQVNLGFVVLSTHLRLSSGRSGSRFPVAKAAARRWIQLGRLGVTRLTRSMLGSQSDRRAVPEDLFFGPWVKVRHIHIAEINVELLCLRLLAGLPLCFWIYIYLYIFVDSSCAQIHAA